MDNVNKLNKLDKLELPGKSERPELEKACRAAIRFARMWGVMETLGKLPPMRTAEEQESICGRYEALVLAWAEEYAAGGDEDPVSFFERKLDAADIVKSGDI